MAHSKDTFPEIAMAVGRDHAGRDHAISSPQPSSRPQQPTGGTPRPGEALNTIVNNIENLLAKSGSLGAATTVEKNVRLIDKDSGTTREFDVLITISDRLRKTLTAIECKDNRRPLDVPVIEAYHTKCQSCGIHHAVIVSSRGFTKAALQKARSKNIGCFTLKAATEPDWLRELGISVIVTKPILGSCEVRWSLPGEVIEGWASGRWKYIMPIGNPFEQAFERSLKINQQTEWQDLHDIRVTHIMNPDKIQILDTATHKRYAADYLSIEVQLERLEHPVIVTYIRYENQHDKTARIDGAVGTFSAMGFEGAVTFIDHPGPTVSGQIEIKTAGSITE